MIILSEEDRSGVYGPRCMVLCFYSSSWRRLTHFVSVTPAFNNLFDNFPGVWALTKLADVLELIFPETVICPRQIALTAA